MESEENDSKNDILNKGKEIEEEEEKEDRKSTR
jgi:hypothetical protein